MTKSDIVDDTYEHKSPPQLEVRHIRPPRLTDAHFSDRLLCYRPVREGRVRIEVEQIRNKTVVHQYGHGGSGWTIGPGSAKYTVDMFERTSPSFISKQTPISILGGGVIGLFTALELHDRGYHNLTVTAADYNNIASHHAGGSFGLSSLPNDTEFKTIVADMVRHSYKTYDDITKQQHKHLRRGARHMPDYFPNREISGHEDTLVGKYMRPAVDVMLDFGTGKQRQMVAYDDGIFMETPTLLHDLQAVLTDIGIKFETRRISSINELPGDVVMNCCGLGAQQLCNDKKMISVQGHLIMLKDQVPGDIEHMISCSDAPPAQVGDFTIKRSFYTFPKRLLTANGGAVGVIGGTFIAGATDQHTHMEEFDRIIRDARDFYGVK